MQPTRKVNRWPLKCHFQTFHQSESLYPYRAPTSRVAIKDLLITKTSAPSKVPTRAPRGTSDSSLPPVPSFWNTPLALGVLLLLVSLTIFFHLGSYGLIDADEGRYASIPLEMLKRGDWVTPMLNGAEFFDKPVLLYWCVMLSYSIFGVSEFAARLPSALFAVAAIGAVYFLNRRTFGARAAFLGAAVLSTAFMWPVLGRVVITDTPLASLSTLALCLWWLGHTSSKRPTWYFAFFWLSLGLGVLTKGPVAVVLAFGAIIPYLLWCRPQNGWKMGASWGIPLLLLIAAPWFLIVQARNPEFNHLFWYEQNFARFLGRGGEPDHWEKPYYFLPFLPLIFFPWSLWIPRALCHLLPTFRRARLHASSERSRAVVFLVFASLFVLLFFSASKSKIVTYIAPLIPPICALLGAYFDSMWQRASKLSLEAGILSALAFVLGVAALIFAPRSTKPLGTSEAIPWIIVAGIFLLGWSLALAISARKRQPQLLVGATAAGFGLVLATIVCTWTVAATPITTRSIVATIRPALTPDSEIASVGFIQSLSFYTGRRVAVDGVPNGADNQALSAISDELRPAWDRLTPTEREPYFYGDHEGLKRFMAHPNPVFVIFRRSRLKYGWGELGPNAHVLTENKRYTIYGNQAAWRQFERTKTHP